MTIQLIKYFITLTDLAEFISYLFKLLTVTLFLLKGFSFLCVSRYSSPCFIKNPSTHNQLCRQKHGQSSHQHVEQGNVMVEHLCVFKSSIAGEEHPTCQLSPVAKL